MSIPIICVTNIAHSTSFYNNVCTPLGITNTAASYDAAQQHFGIAGSPSETFKMDISHLLRASDRESANCRACPLIVHNGKHPTVCLPTFQTFGQGNKVDERRKILLIALKAKGDGWKDISVGFFHNLAETTHMDVPNHDCLPSEADASFTYDLNCRMERCQ